MGPDMSDCLAEQLEVTVKAASAANTGSAGNDGFAQIIDRHQGALLRYVRRMAGLSPEQAEDVVQECFLRLHRHWQQSPGPQIQRVEAWLFSVAHNLTIDLMRKQKLQPAGPDQATTETQESEELSALSQIAQNEAASAALAAMDRLPAGHKQVVLMKVLQGLTYREIAKATGMSLSNVNYKLNQALELMAKELKQAGHV